MLFIATVFVTKPLVEKNSCFLFGTWKFKVKSALYVHYVITHNFYPQQVNLMETQLWWENAHMRILELDGNLDKQLTSHGRGTCSERLQYPGTAALFALQVFAVPVSPVHRCTSHMQCPG